MTSGPYAQELEDLVQLSRLALTGRLQDVQTFVRRLSKRIKASKPDVSEQLEAFLSAVPAKEAMRAIDEAVVPRDADSRLKLIREEFPINLDVEPIWAANVKQRLGQLVEERHKQDVLAKEGLLPTRSVLLTGKPGVGKSLAARWIAQQLNRPLVTLDLSAVMSSFLGKTGANVRHVLDYAKATSCVLFLDELDAVAKRRDDVTEIGELKRLVTVLLQEIDDWPATGLLIAATNHPDLLDPAVWRRFEMIIEFPMPSEEQVQVAVQNVLGARVPNRDLLEVTALVLRDHSFSDIARELQRLVRDSIVSSRHIEEPLRDFVRSQVGQATLEKRKTIASCLINAGFTQRETHEWTRVHRDTLRKMSTTSTEVNA